MKSLLTLLLLGLAVLGCNGFEWLDEISCQNGGTPNATECNCFDYFTGPYCSEINCLNNGYLNDTDADRCICPVGYYGLYCESYQQAPAPTDLFLIKSPDLIIFLNTRVDMTYNSFQIYKSAVLADPAISRGLKGMYSNYYLFEFDNEDPERTQQLSFDKREDFIKEFNRSDLVLRYNEANCKPEPIFQNILPWIKENQFSQQTINIFTQLPSTTDDLESLENLAVAFNLQFNIYFQYSDVVCETDEKHDTLFAFELLTQRTGGFYWPFYQFDGSSKMVSDLVRSTFNLQLLGYQAYTKGNCPTTLTTTFNHALGPVDIYALVKSESTSVAITSSTTPPISKTVAATGTTVIALFPPITSDTISVKNATGACSIEILGIKRDPLETEYLGIKAYVSFTDSINADSSYFAMKSGVMQYIRIHLENIVNTSFALTPLSVHLSSDCQSNIPTTSFSKSPSSTFDYISYTALNCLAQFNSCQATKHWLTITFNVSQVQNTFTVLRHVPIKCLSSTDNEVPTTEAPPTTQPATTVAPVTTLAAGDTTTAAGQQTTTVAPTTEAPTTQPPTTEAPTTPEATTTEAVVTTAAPQETTEGGSTAPPTPFTCPTDSTTLPAMIIGYSVQYDATTIKTFLKSPLILNASIADPYYGYYASFTIDDDDSNYDSNHSPADTFTDFMASITRLAASYSPGNPNKPTNIIPVLRKMFNDSRIKDRSAVLILIGNTTPEGDKNDKTEILQLAASRQIRINFYIDKTLYQTTADPERFKFYEQVSAVSDGHFLIADVNKADNSSPPYGYFVPQKIFSMLYYESFPHKLAMSKIVSITGAPNNVGTLDLTGQTGNRSFYLTAAYSPYINNASSVFLFVVLTNKNGGQSPAPIPLTCGYGNIGCGAILSVPAGAAYDITITNTIYDESSTLTYRLWEHWQDGEEYKLKTEYMDFNSQYQEELPGPIYDVAAVPRVTLSQFLVDKIDKLEVEFLDCSGQRVLAFDHYDYATLISNDSTCGTSFMVNPFVCNFAQTCSLQRDILQGFYTTKYKIRTTDNTVLEYSTNFWCRENIKSLSEQCPYNPSVISSTDAPTTTSSAGSTVSPIESDCQCLNLTAPHLRGPVCTVPDCSKNGYLQYDTAVNDFFCQCKEGYNGTYCEIGICSNTASRTAKDVNYRTLTIAIVHSNRDEFNNIVNELQNADFTILDNIWQFNVFTVCNGNIKTRYFGTSKDTFINVLNGLKSNFDAGLLNYCGTGQSVDFTSIVKYGLSSVGKEVRGVFWIATHNSDIIEVTSMMDFYYVVQGYKQELFLTSITADDGEQLSNFNATLEAVRVTGGERIDFESYDGSNYASYIQNIAASQTSLNYYELITDSVSVLIPIEADAYLTISNYSYTDSVSTDPDATCVLQPSNDITALIYKCSKSDALKLTASIQNGSALITVRVLGGYTPAWIIINETNQDNLEAMPVLNSFPSIAFDFNGASIDPHDTTPDSFARQAERENCAFKYTSTFQLPVTSTGYDNFEITIDETYKKIIPYVITDTLENRCKNGNGTLADAKCSCLDRWSGADCSRPICEYGSLNTMQNACYCDLTHSGQTCSTPQLY